MEDDEQDEIARARSLDDDEEEDEVPVAAGSKRPPSTLSADPPPYKKPAATDPVSAPPDAAPAGELTMTLADTDDDDSGPEDNVKITLGAAAGVNGASMKHIASTGLSYQARFVVLHTGQPLHQQ